LTTLDAEECFINATLVMAKDGGADVGATKRGQRHENHGDCGPPCLIGDRACDRDPSDDSCETTTLNGSRRTIPTAVSCLTYGRGEAAAS
jgi:hypothetical protein